MKVKVWTPDCVNDTDDCFYMKLIDHTSNGQIGLVLCDKLGNAKNKNELHTLLLFDFDYKVIVLFENVDSNFPIKQDLYGSPLVVSEKEIREYEKTHTMRSIENKLKNELFSELEKLKKQNQPTLN